MAKRWTLEDIPWHRVERDRIQTDHLQLAKAAAIVEYNAGVYAAYLQNVFADDLEFSAAARQWGEEETKHGAALARWAMLVDPCFDFEGSLAIFRAGVAIDTGADSNALIRGSRSDEILARCTVEVGTSSYYEALGDAVQEPALKAIFRKIAADDLRHYKLFYEHLCRYRIIEGPSHYKNLKMGLGRILETEDNARVYAFYAANMRDFPYDPKSAYREYMLRANQYYLTTRVERGEAMIFKAVGLKPHAWPFQLTTRGGDFFMELRRQRMARLAAA